MHTSCGAKVDAINIVNVHQQPQQEDQLEGLILSLALSTFRITMYVP